MINSHLQVNSHGVLSFQSEFVVVPQQPLPLNNTAPLILLFWSDTNRESGSNIYYRGANDSETLRMCRSLLLNVAHNSFRPTSAFVATWDRVVQTFTIHSNLANTYQAVLITDGELSYICLLYKDVQWGSGAQIGFNAGDGRRSFTVPGGLTSQTLNMESLSNVGRPGVFIYQVNGRLKRINDLA